MKVPPDATWICLAQNKENIWLPIAYGKDERDCIKNAERCMRNMSIAGAQICNVHYELYNPN